MPRRGKSELRFPVYARPTTLYRYRSLDPHRLNAMGRRRDTFEEEMQAITEGYVWGSAYRDLNDPMEGLYEAVTNGAWDGSEFTRGVRAVLDRKQSVGIASFSEAPDLDLMWAHYADGAKGICIAYHLEALAHGLEPGSQVVRVMYGERPSSIHFDEGANYEVLAKTVLSTKSSRWLYEREWRLLLPHFQKNSYGNVEVITRVYLGPRMEEGMKERIRDRISRFVDVSDVLVDGYRFTSPDGHW